MLAALIAVATHVVKRKLIRRVVRVLLLVTPLVIAGLCYLIITVPLSLLVRRLEAHNNRAR